MLMQHSRKSLSVESSLRWVWPVALLAGLPCALADDADLPAGGPQLKVATCQFPVSGRVDENAEYIKDFIKEAASNEADIVHFSEAALSGYAGVDVPRFRQLRLG